MAHVVHSPIPFYSHPVSHAPTPLGFGFGLNPVPASWSNPSATPGHTNPASFQQLASSINQQSSPRAQKRRHESEDDEVNAKVGLGRDQSMDRSPTPERPKRAVPKRARVVSNDLVKGDTTKQSKSRKADDDDVDVGMLLASLPPHSLLPLLNSLLTVQPELKTTILPLIPRPTLDTALDALSKSSKKLLDAFPYSNMPFGSMTQSGTFGHGSGFSSSRVSGFGAFGRPPVSNLGQPINSNGHTSGMRDSYIISRLRPHIDEFVSACMSYLPYFSYITAVPQPGPASNPTTHSNTTSHFMAIQTLHKDKSHPAETFTFLSALTTHLLSQPPLTQNSLAPLLLPRLSEEWKAWVSRVDEVVNRQGGMFGSETVGGWEKGLNDFAARKGPEGFHVMREIRDSWINKVGWLVGRMPHYPMEEEL